MSDGFATPITTNALRFERRLPGPIERVWAYLTEPDLMERWFYRHDIPSVAGGTFGSTWEGEDGEPGGRMTATVRVYEPPHVLEYEWTELDAPGASIQNSVVRWELADDPPGVLLTLTHSALPPAAFSSIGAGWHAHLDTLVALVEGHDGPDANARYALIEEEYQRRFDTPASA